MRFIPDYSWWVKVWRVCTVGQGLHVRSTGVSYAAVPRYGVVGHVCHR